MDILTLSIAVKKALAAMGIKTAPGMVLDPRKGTETTIINGITYRKVSDDYIDLSKAEHIYVSESGEYGEVPKDVFVFESQTIDGKAIKYVHMGEPETKYAYSVSVSIDPFQKGTWVFCDDNSNSFMIFRFPKTIHPIDPKYLPGVCLPVVELSTEIVDEAFLTDADGAMLTGYVEKQTPILVRFRYNGNTITSPAALSEFEGGAGFIVPFGSQSIQFGEEGGSWHVGIF